MWISLKSAAAALNDASAARNRLAPMGIKLRIRASAIYAISLWALYDPAESMSIKLYGGIQ
jgi:hypothetical protein